MKLRPGICSPFQPQVKYLGRIVSANGHCMDPKETSALEALRQKRPATVTEVQQILGLLGYYRRYVPNFSRRAKVLYDLLKQDQGQDPRNQTQRKQSKDKKTKPLRRKNDPVKWEAVHQDTLESILDCLKQPLVMA